MADTYVFVDTNILLFCSMGTRSKHEPLLLKALDDALRDSGATLLLPEVVELEYKNLMRTRGELYRKSSDKALAEALDKLSAETDKIKVTDVFGQINKDRAKAMAEAAEYFEGLAVGARTLRITTSGDAVARALTYSIAGKAPSKGKTARERADLTPSEPGYTVEPDCLIIASIREALLRATSSSKLVVCTDNVKDFAVEVAAGQFDLHPDIASQMPCETAFFRSMPELLAHGFGGVISEDAKVQYEDAVQEAVALTAQLSGVKSPVSALCPSCSTKVGVELGVLAGSTTHPTCPVCGCGFFVHRAKDGAVFTRTDGEAKQITVALRCPDCGNRFTFSRRPGEEDDAQRICFSCLAQLTISADGSSVSVDGKAEPTVARVVRYDGEVPTVMCPACSRKLRTIGKTHAGRFGVCNSTEHAPLLLIAGAVDNAEGGG